MRNSFSRHSLVTVLLAVSLINHSAASDDVESPWEFQLAPLFIWGISIDGDATLGSDTAPLNLNFQDGALENMEAVYAVHFEAKKNEFSLFTEYQYVKLEPEVGIGPLQTEVDFKNIMLEVGATFMFSDTGSTTLESMFGFRYVDQQVDVAANINLPPTGPGPQTRDIDGGDDWWHPFMGMRLGQRLADRWTLLARVDYGYAASDNKALNTSAMIDFRFNHWGSLFAGYRYIDFDYDDGSGADRYAFQAAQQGPLLGLNIRW